MISPMTVDDWPDVQRIYSEGIATGLATFETAVPDWEEWDDSHLRECRFVARRNGEAAGWAALSPVSDRCVYGGVAEVSIYVSPAHAGKGVGSELMEALIASSEAAGLWTLQAGVFPENEASVVLHIKHGFRKVGTRERLGRLDGKWRDVALLERRSTVVG